MQRPRWIALFRSHLATHIHISTDSTGAFVLTRVTRNQTSTSHFTTLAPLIRRFRQRFDEDVVKAVEELHIALYSTPSTSLRASVNSLLVRPKTIISLEEGQMSSYSLLLLR